MTIILTQAQIFCVFANRCKDQSSHVEFQKQTGAASVVYHSDLSALVVLVCTQTCNVSTSAYKVWRGISATPFVDCFPQEDTNLKLICFFIARHFNLQYKTPMQDAAEKFFDYLCTIVIWPNVSSQIVLHLEGPLQISST